MGLKKRNGSALVIAVLLMAVIATASFGIARLVLVEINNGQIQTANLKAYYLAEAGVEEGLLRWRYDHKTELAAGSRQVQAGGADGLKWQITSLDGADSKLAALSSDFSTLDSANNYTSLTIFNKVKNASLDTLDNLNNAFTSFAQEDASFAGTESNFRNQRPDLFVAKDNKISFSFADSTQTSDDLSLAWRWQKLAALNSATANISWNDPQKNGELCPNGSIRKKGDINCNGNFDIQDANSIMLYSAGRTDLLSVPNINPCYYDMNNDGQVTRADSDLLMQYWTSGVAPSEICGAKFGVEVRMYKRDTTGLLPVDKLLAKKVFSPSGPNQISGVTDTDNASLICSEQACKISNIKASLGKFAVAGETYITLTPIGADILVSAFGNNNKEFTDSVSHLQSVGVSRGRMRGLDVQIDQNSGQILGLFDYALFQGQ